ncbi:MAG: SLC13 family permease [Acidimicrobiales bacterium]
MNADSWIFIAVVLVMFTALVSRRVSPAVGVVGALMALFLIGVIDSDQALQGFSNRAPVTIACMYVVAGAIDRTGALTPIVRSLTGARSTAAGLARVIGVSGIISSIVANTPVVAMLINPLVGWSGRQRISPSKVLIPLSYATLFGGMITLIGTSTNLVGSGVVSSLGEEPFGLLEPAKLGLPIAALGLVMVVVLGPRLLPDRGGRIDENVERPFTVSLVVEPGGALDDATVQGGGLRNLPGVFLVGLEREGELTAPVHPEHALRGGDQLTFAGQVDQVVELERTAGLKLDGHKHLMALEDGEHSWFEAVIGASSSLIGSTIKAVGFRGRYQAAVVALHRSGEAVEGRLGDVRLQVGDSLLLVADSQFRSRWKDRSDFLLIASRSEPPPTASKRAPLALLVMAMVAVLPLLGVTDVLRSAVLGAAATVVLGLLTPRQARDSVDLSVIVLIAAAIGVGAAAESTGVATTIADGLVSALGWAGTWGVALGVVLATLTLTELVTNAAAVAIVVPIAMRVAEDSGADPRLFALGATLAASASFLTPIGYQTNTMVYGPGRYRFADYLRLGVPLTLMIVVALPLMMANGWSL